MLTETSPVSSTRILIAELGQSSLQLEGTGTEGDEELLTAP